MRSISFGGFCAFLLSIFLFSVVFPLTSMADVGSEATSLLATAKEMLSSGDVDTAETLLQQIIQQAPNTVQAVEAHQELAIQYIQSKRTEEAESLVEDLKKNYAGFPETVDSLYAIARKYQQNGMPKEAISLHRYNSATFPKTQKAMWSQGAMIHQYIDLKDFEGAQREFDVLTERFKDQPTLPQEIHQCAEKYRTTDEPERALALNQYNVAHSPTSSKFTMWSQGAIVHHYINQGDFAVAKRETDVMISRFSEQPTLPQELHLIAEKYKWAGEADRSLELHQYNATHSPVSSMYTMQSQGALVHYYIEQKEFYPAEVEFNVMVDRFKDQPTLPQEIYQFAIKYGSVGAADKALEMHRYNAAHSPASSLYAMQSQGAIVHHYIEQKDFDAAQREFDVMVSRFSEQETFPQELYQFALKYDSVGVSDKALEVHRYNVEHSPVSSKYTIWSQGALIHHYINEKDFIKSQQECDLMISRFSDQPTLAHELSMIVEKYRQARENELAKSLCQRAIQKYQNTSDCLDFQTNLVRVLLTEKNYTQADEVSTQMVTAYYDKPEYVKMLNELGGVYKNNKRFIQSLQYYQEALEKASSADEKINAYAGIAMVSARMGDDAKVMEIVDLLIKDYKGHDRLGYSVYFIGEEYWLEANYVDRQQDPDRSLDCYANALSVWQRSIKEIDDSEYKGIAYYYSGIANQEAGQIKEINQQQECWRNYENATLCYAAILNDYSSAYYYSDSLVRLNQCCWELYTQKQLSAENTAGIMKGAIDILIDKYPQIKIQETAWHLGEIMFKTAQWQNAARYLELSMPYHKRDIQRQAEVYYQLGLIYEKLGQEDKAVSSYLAFVNRTDPIKDNARLSEAMQKINQLK